MYSGDVNVVANASNCTVSARRDPLVGGSWNWGVMETSGGNWLSTLRLSPHNKIGFKMLLLVIVCLKSTTSVSLNITKYRHTGTYFYISILFVVTHNCGESESEPSNFHHTQNKSSHRHALERSVWCGGTTGGCERVYLAGARSTRHYRDGVSPRQACGCTRLC